MARYYPLFAAATLFIGALVMLNSTQANDENSPPVAEKPQEELPTVADLLKRIDQLEKRLATLEEREPLIRQADSRETMPVFESAPPNSNVTPPAAVWVPQPPVTPHTPDETGSNAKQRTNGQKWSFRLLSHQQSTSQK